MLAEDIFISGERHRANRLFGVPLPLHSYIRSAHSGTASPPLQSGASVIFRAQLPLRIGRFWNAVLPDGKTRAGGNAIMSFKHR